MVDIDVDVNDFFSGSGTGFFTAKNDSNFTITSSNESFLSMTGLADAKDAKNRSLKSCLTTTSFELVKHKLSSFSGKSLELELAFKKIGGSSSYGLFTFYLDKSSKEAAITGTISDISAIKKRELALKNQNDGLIIGMENMSALVWEYD